jgi:hypothetical protein
MRHVTLLRDIALWAFWALLLSLLRLLMDAVVLEPHYFWLLKSGLLQAPLLIARLPLTLWADMAAAAVLTLGARFGSRGPLSPPVFAFGLCLLFAHLGQGDPLKLPLIIPAAWAVSSAAGAFGIWKLALLLKPDPAMRPLAELGS